MAELSLAGWWRRQSLRLRLTVLATAALTVGLVGGAALLVSSLERSLLSALDSAARQRAQDVAAQIDAGGPVAGQLPLAPGTVSVVQVLDAAGQVRAATAGAERVPLVPPDQLAALAGGQPRMVGRAYGLPLRVVAVPAGPPQDRLMVLAGVGVGEVRESVRFVRDGLLLGVPPLLVLVALVGWRTVGSALRPVDELRAGADDITGRERGARRLPVPEARDEVGRLARTLNAMLTRLDAAAARQQAFVADAAHELRSPLASVRAQLEVALAHPEGADWPATAEGVLVDTLRLSRLVDDLLVLARLDAGRLPARREELDLGEVATATAQRLPSPRVPVTVHPAPPVLVRADPDALVRITRNLLDNAVRHAATRVDVEVSLAGGAVLRIRDDGPGIPAQDRERAFERFTRLDDDRSRDAGGSGLGLSIARELSRAYGGDVRAEAGAVTVTLPAAR